MLIVAYLKHSRFLGTRPYFRAVPRVGPSLAGPVEGGAGPGTGGSSMRGGGAGAVPVPIGRPGARLVGDWLARGVPGAGAPTAPLSGAGAAGAERAG